MRFFKKTVFWVLMLALLGGSFYLYDRKSEGKKAEVEAKKRFFSFQPGDVAGFTVKKKDEEPVSVKKEGDGWIITSPIVAKGDKENIEKFLDGFVKASFDGVLFDTIPEGKLKEMGLDNPYLTVGLETKSGVKSAVSFGEKGPTQNVSFAVIKDDPRILRVHTDIRKDADKAVYDLRDKTIAFFDPTKVKKFEIKWTGGERIAVEHPAEGKWNAAGLGEGKTDFLRVMELLVKLKKSEIKAFIDETPKSLALFGLATPRVVIAFVDEKGKNHLLIIGGRDREKRGYYAVRGGEKNVFLVEEDLMDSIPRTVLDMEEKNEEPKG